MYGGIPGPRKIPYIPRLRWNLDGSVVESMLSSVDLVRVRDVPWPLYFTFYCLDL